MLPQASIDRISHSTGVLGVDLSGAMAGRPLSCYHNAAYTYWVAVKEFNLSY